MGYISNLAKGISLDSGLGEPRKPFDRDLGRQLWSRIFGATSKEEGSSPRVRPGGSWAHGMVSEPAATKRLLQAFRSKAPGGWSDDRWEQEKHYTGLPYVAIERIGRMFSQAEFQVYVKDRHHPDGKIPITEDSPSHGERFVRPYDLVKLLERPNNQDSFGQMLFRWCQQLRLTGTALTWMVPNKFGTPFELYPIPTSMAIPQPAINPDYPDGYYRIQPLYPYGPFSSYPTPSTAVGAPIPAQWMLRFMYPHPLLRYDGYSPLTGLRLHTDVLESMDRSRFYMAKRQITPSAILNFAEMEGAQPLPEEEIERIRATFENDFEGPENAGRLYVATPGAELQQWDQNLRDLQFTEGWDQLASFVLGGGFGITKPAAGMVEDTNYSTLFATLKQLYLITMDPEADYIGGELTHHLAPFFGDNLIVEVRCKRIDDHEIKQAFLKLMMEGKAIKKNELRKALDFPITKESWGDEFAGPKEEQPGMTEPTLPSPAAGASSPQSSPNQSQQPSPNSRSPQAQAPEVEAARPSPGGLSRGALGPRGPRSQVTKALKSKSLYSTLRKALVATNGKH